MEGERLLEGDLAESLKDIFEDMDGEESDSGEYDSGGHAFDEGRISEPNRRIERNNVVKKTAEEGPLRAPRSRKEPKERQKKTSEKKEEPKRSQKPEKETREKKPASRRRDIEGYDERRNMRRQRNVQPLETGESALQAVGDAAVKGATGVLVLSSRVMQLISALLMAVMTGKMALVFFRNGTGLGLIDTMLTDRNYGLILYVGAAGFSVFMGAIWCLWILSKQAGGGQVRLKKYDVGRGFFPFLICLAVVFVIGAVSPWVLPETDKLGTLAEGITAFLMAVNGQRDFLFFCGVVGAVLSFIRKVLRV